MTLKFILWSITRMALLSFCETSTYRWSFEEDVHALQQAGIPAIHVWRRKLADFGEEKAAHLLEDVGLKVSALSWIGGFTGSDGHSHKESLQDAKTAILQAAELQANCLVVYSGSKSGHTQNHANRMFKNALSELLPLAEEHNIPLAIEPMHYNCGSDWTFHHCIEEVLELIEKLKSPLVQLVADLYHIGHDPQSIQLLTEHIDKVALVQLADGVSLPADEQNRCLLGDGILPIRELIQSLNQAGYHGYYDVELLGADVEQHTYQDLIEHSRNYFDQAIE